jgi:tetratricopeptide (TPR) repeat protein
MTQTKGNPPEETRDISPEATHDTSPGETRDVSDATDIVSPPVWPKGAAARLAGAPDTWPPGRVVADRYRIVKFLGRGGMGDVYEAEDLELQGRVALKTVRLDIVADPRLSERFKREIQIARKVTHPNVCRIYDVGYERVLRGGDSGEAPAQVRFLTMELLPGETLSDRVMRKRRLTTAEARPIVEHMAAGLDAIHALGVIHRDFKSGNVMLVSSLDSRRGERAVVTDFGLARPEATTESLASISESGGVVGTPAYMAPEQVEGKELTAAADIYALGIVMYEMVTGVRPFDGGSAITVAVKRLKEPPPPPRRHVPDLDPRWETVILRCLEREPAGRFASALDVVKALNTDGIDTAAPTRELIQPRLAGIRGKRLAYAGTAVLIVASAIALYARRDQIGAPASGASQGTTKAATVTPRRSVAVVGLRNTSGRPDAAWLSTAIAEMLTTELGAGEKVRVVSGEDVARVKRDLALDEIETVTKALSDTLRQNLGTELAVLGSYTLVAGPGSRLLRIDLRLHDLSRAEPLGSVGATGTEEQLFDLVSRAGAGLRQKLGLEALSPAQALEVEAATPSNPRAARAYAEGITKLRLLDAKGARELLESALAVDPKHPLIHAALAEAWSALGYDQNAREEAKKATALAASLPSRERLSIEGRFHEVKKDWPKAIETYRGLFQSFPDDLEYGLRLADAQTLGGKAKEALVTLESLRRLPAPSSSDPRIDLAAARAYQRLGDYKGERSAAAGAAAKGKASGSRLLVASARLLESTAYRSLGDSKKALEATEEARALFDAAGDRRGAARAIERMAVAVYKQGDLDGARRLFEKCLALDREIGDEAGVARVLENTGNVLLDQGHLADAERLYDESLRTFQKIGARYEAATVLTNLGARFQNRGDLVTAQKRYEQALAIFGELGEKSGTAVTLTNIAEILYSRGELEQARKMHEESLAINREIGDKSGAAYDLFRLGEVFAAQGDLLAARDRYQEALAIQEPTGDKIPAAETRLALARIALAQGRAEEAEASARQAEEVLRTEGAADREALAQVVLAQALLARGKPTEAQEAADRAGKLAAKSDDRRVLLGTTILEARMQAASSKPDAAKAALQLLDTALTDATRAGLVDVQLEARLARAETEARAGGSTALAHLDGVAAEAKRKGFGQIARRATEARARLSAPRGQTRKTPAR